MLKIIKKALNGKSKTLIIQNKENMLTKEEIYKKHMDLFDLSIEHEKEGNIEKSIDVLKFAIRKYHITDDSKSYFQLAHYYQLQNDWTNSRLVIKQALQKIDLHNPYEYYRLNCDVLNEEIKHLKKENDIYEYFYHLPMFIYCSLITHALNGCEDFINDFYHDTNSLFVDLDLIDNSKLRKEYMTEMTTFFKDKEEAIFNILNYTKDKTRDNVSRKILNKLLDTLHFSEISKYYNQNLAYKMSVLKDFDFR